MTTVEMVMPAMGESIMEGTILQWLKKEGDTVEQEESLLEVATDKVDTEVPATHSGVLQKILAPEGEVVEVGKPIAIIAQEGSNGQEDDTDASSATANATSETTEEERNPQTTPSEQEVTPVLTEALTTTSSSPTRFYSPLVMSIAKEEGISVAELEQIPGTGKEGRLTKRDLLNYLKSPKESSSNNGHTSQPKPHATVAVPEPITTNGHQEVIEMDRMRKMIATRMVSSKQISAHVTSFVEADVTSLVNWRHRVKDTFLAREGEKITFMPLFIEAVAKAIKDYPMINISVDGDTIVRHKTINIGMAVALPNGNLIVPVIKGADQLSLTGLTKKINDVSSRARNNQLAADDLAGGTYTVSNIGSFGNLLGTPIIMQPQVAILALGAIVKKPSVVETAAGDAIAVRHKMYLSHSYDHRVVDGALGGMFVRRVADYLEKFDVERDLH